MFLWNIWICSLIPCYFLIDSFHIIVGLLLHWYDCVLHLCWHLLLKGSSSHFAIAKTSLYHLVLAMSSEAWPYTSVMRFCPVFMVYKYLHPHWSGKQFQFWPMSYLISKREGAVYNLHCSPPGWLKGSHFVLDRSHVVHLYKQSLIFKLHSNCWILHFHSMSASINWFNSTV